MSAARTEDRLVQGFVIRENRGLCAELGPSQIHCDEQPLGSGTGAYYSVEHEEFA